MRGWWNGLLETLSKPDLYSRRIIGLCVGVGIVAGVIVYLAPKSYESEVVLLVDSGSQSVDLLSAFRGRDFPAIGSLDPFGGREAGNTYAEILQSREVLTHLLRLKRPSTESPAYFDAFAPKWGSTGKRVEKAVKALRSAIEVDYQSRNGMLTITVTTDDRELSSEVANQLALELQRFDSDVRKSRTSDAVVFVNERLKEAAQDLSVAEANLARFRASNARIGNAPHLELEEKRLERRVRLNEETYALLARELEMTRIQEKRENPVFSVVDRAIPSVRPAGLHPIIAAALASGLFAIVTLFLVAAFAARRRDGPAVGTKG